MKFERVYCYSRTNVRASEDDFIVGYKAENGKTIEVLYMYGYISNFGYKVDGKTFDKLADAKKACERGV